MENGLLDNRVRSLVYSPSPSPYGHREQTYNQISLKRVFENQAEAIYLSGEMLYLSPRRKPNIMDCQPIWIKSAIPWVCNGAPPGTWKDIIESYKVAWRTEGVFAYVMESVHPYDF